MLLDEFVKYVNLLWVLFVMELVSKKLKHKDFLFLTGMS